MSAPTIAATSSASTFARERLPRLSVIVVSGALCVSGTSSAEPNRLWDAPYIHEYDATASGEDRVESIDDDAGHRDATREAVAELRRISGLTWEQLGQLFAVSRRSVHFWASGKPLNADNEKRLLQVLDIVRTADRGDARSTRSALLDVHDGVSAFDLLVDERFDEARARLGVGAGRPRPVLGELSAEAKAARAPLRPEELVGALQDRVHKDPGHARPARTVRNSRRGTT
jgi:DNA-binding transcriptional regulator YiaG